MLQSILLRAMPALFVLLLTGCTDHFPYQPIIDEGGYTLSSRYTHIRSYPGGGGIFTPYIVPDGDFRGTVRLALQCDPALHARINRTFLDTRHRDAEIIIEPEAGLSVDSCVITLLATHDGTTKTLPLRITMYHWSHGDPGEEMALLDSFLDWQRRVHPELSSTATGPWRRWLTYPEHLIVEHWTLLNPYWEIRLCRHVMVPPDDWSMILMRPLGMLTPLLAAYRDSDGSIQEIPVSEYPVFYGY